MREKGAQPSVPEPEPESEPDSEPALSPIVLSPAVAQPAVAQPAVAQPAVAQPAVAQPAVGQPAVGQPAVGQPASVLEVGVVLVPGSLSVSSSPQEGKATRAADSATASRTVVKFFFMVVALGRTLRCAWRSMPKARPGYIFCRPSQAAHTDARLVRSSGLSQPAIARRDSQIMCARALPLLHAWSHRIRA